VEVARACRAGGRAGRHQREMWVAVARPPVETRVVRRCARGACAKKPNGKALVQLCSSSPQPLDDDDDEEEEEEDGGDDDDGDDCNDVDAGGGGGGDAGGDMTMLAMMMLVVVGGGGW